MSATVQQLKTKMQELQKQTRVQSHLDQLNGQLKEEYKQLDRLYKKLQKEFRDVEELEKLSMKGLFHNVLGNKDKQLEKERQEYLQASLKYNEAKNTIDLLEYEKKVLDDQVKNKAALEIEVQKLMKMREKELVAQAGSKGQEILQIILRVDQIEDRIDALRACHQNGQRIVQLLQNMEAHLQKAQNWGQWDMMGDRHSGHYKSNAIDKARDLAYHVKNLIRRYEKDIYQLFGNTGHLGLDLQLEGFNRFTDVFFDNLISDWIIQQKIRHATSNVSAVHDRLVRVQQNLKSDEQEQSNLRSKLLEQRRQILLT